MQNYMQDKSADLAPAYRRLLAEGKRSRVLNNMKLGVDALQLNHNDEALRAFNNATLEISTIFADNEAAVKARSLWYEEGQKDFKGEPYERVMAYYYLGLLDLGRGDYENARASFKSGILQDAFAEEEQNRCDFASLIFLVGWASQLNGDQELAKAAYDEVLKLLPDFKPPYGNNGLIIIETGKSPRKVADGPGHAELKFRRGRKFSDFRAEISINNDAFIQAYRIEDIYLQAATRGGRQVDKIIEGKAHFRSKTAQTGSTLSSVSEHIMMAGSALTSVPVLMGVGAAIGLVSVTHMALAARTRAYADIRYWDNLPDAIHIMPVTLPPGTYSLKVRFKDENGGIVPGMMISRTFKVGGNNMPLLWLRSRLQISKDLKY